MNQKTAHRLRSFDFVEPLERRTLLSAGGIAPARKAPHAAVSRTVFHVSRRTAKLGQSVTFTATVTAAKKLGPISGTVEFLNNGVSIASTSGALNVPLDSHHRAIYTFAAGNVALFLGRQRFSADFFSDSPTTVPNSLSRTVIVNVTVPKLKNAPNGVETATVHPGHGKGLKPGLTATVRYTGFLADSGEIFEDTAESSVGDPSDAFTYVADATPGQVPAGFDQGTKGMKAGETRVLAIPAALGYGAAGSGTAVPSDADLVYLVTLLKVG